MKGKDDASEGFMRPFLDLMFCYVTVLVVIVSLLNSTKKPTREATKPHAIYQVVMTWDGTSPDDVDLWAEDPNNKIVGFNRREGPAGCLMSLDHDDLGHKNDTNLSGDVTEVNQEVVSIRGCVEGEYVFNAHYFAKRGDSEELTVSAKLIKVKPYEELVAETVTLYTDGDEETFFRFELDGDGDFVSANRMKKHVATVGR